MQQCRKLLKEYRNGNYKVRIFSDGTKVRFSKDDEFCPKFPESIDLKITNQCDLRCPMCHEKSTPMGKEGDLNHPFLDTLVPGTELAIGGGNPLEHRDLIPFLQKMKRKGIICNITVNQVHLVKHKELIQMVRLFKDGQEFKMSKRTGNAVSMKELCEDCGVDAVRYFFVSRAASSHLDFDLDLAGKMDSSNPVYYAQYAHARLCAVLEKAKDINLDIEGKNLKEEKELKLLKVLCDFPKEIVQAAEARAPFKITNYIQKLATTIHEFYTECRVIDETNLDVTSSRLALCKAAKIVMSNALTTIGVSAPTKM